MFSHTVQAETAIVATYLPSPSRRAFALVSTTSILNIQVGVMEAAYKRSLHGVQGISIIKVFLRLRRAHFAFIGRHKISAQGIASSSHALKVH